MKKLNITKEAFNKSKYFTKKYGKLKYVSESGKLFKTSKGKVLKFNESGIEKKSVVACPSCGKTVWVPTFAKDGTGCPHCGNWIEFHNESKEYDPNYPDNVLEEFAEEYYSTVKDGLTALKEFRSKAIDYAPTCSAELDASIRNLEEVVEWMRIGATEGFCESSDNDETKKPNGLMIDESTDDGSWFDEYGYLIKEIPELCVRECSRQGKVDDDCNYWVDELGFDKNFPNDLAKDYLKQFGGWEDEEIDKMDTHTLAEIVLWLFCGDLKEDPERPLTLQI